MEAGSENWPRWLGLACKDSNFLEAIIAALYGRWLRPGDHAVDGGANRGLHTWRMSEAVGETGMVLAVEPVPPLAARLERMARRRGMTQVKVTEAALGQIEGSASFVWVRAAATRSGLKTRPDMTPEWRSSIERIDVSVRRLDDLARGLKLEPRFIKLDLEGGEFGALRGASATLLESRPMIVFEHGGQSSADLYGYAREEWFALFDRAGYSVYTLFGQVFSRDSWGTPGLPWYFLAVPMEGPGRQFLGEQLVPLILDVEAWWRRSFQAFGRRWRKPALTARVSSRG